MGDKSDDLIPEVFQNNKLFSQLTNNRESSSVWGYKIKWGTNKLIWFQKSIISYFPSSPIIEQVLWFEVPVNNTFLVHVRYCWQHLKKYPSSYLGMVDIYWGTNSFRWSFTYFYCEFAFYLFDQIGGILFWIGTLLDNSIKQLAPRHSVRRRKTISGTSAEKSIVILFLKVLLLHFLLVTVCVFLFSLESLIQLLHRNWITISLNWKRRK